MRQFRRALSASAVLVCLLLGIASQAIAVCREAASSQLPMPTWTWLRAWRADFSAPTRLALDAQGRVHATDPTRAQVIARREDGAIALVKTNLGTPTSIAMAADGRILLGDGASGRVTILDSDWVPLYPLGAGDGEFGHPGDIAVDPASGEIYVTDTARNVVVVYSNAGIRLRTIGSPAPNDGSFAPDGQFRTPTGIAIDGAEVLVADQLNFRIQAFDKSSGAFLYCIGTYRTSVFVPPGGGPGRAFAMPQGLWVDALGRLYVADAFQALIRVVDRSNGAILGSIGAFGQEPGGLRVPSDIVIDRHGRLIVASSNNARLEIYGLDGYSDPERFAPALLTVAPDTLDRQVPPPSVEFRLEVPGYRVADIDPLSILVNGIPTNGTGQGDADGDGIPELVLLVDSNALLATLGPGPSGTATVTGSVGPLLIEARAELSITGGPVDADGDGVLDDRDFCPGTAAGDVVDAQGCAIRQLCPCEGPTRGGEWRDHGEYVSCVSANGRVFRDAGVIPGTALGTLVSGAAQSSCGSLR